MTDRLAVLFSGRERHLATQVAAASIAALATSGLSAVTAAAASRLRRSLSPGGSAGNSLTAAPATAAIVFPDESEPAPTPAFASRTSDAELAIIIFLNRAIRRHHPRQRVVN